MRLKVKMGHIGYNSIGNLLLSHNLYNCIKNYHVFADQILEMARKKLKKKTYLNMGDTWYHSKEEANLSQNMYLFLKN